MYTEKINDSADNAAFPFLSSEMYTHFYQV